MSVVGFFSLFLSTVSSSDDLPSAVRVDPPRDAHPPPLGKKTKQNNTSLFVSLSMPFLFLFARKEVRASRYIVADCCCCCGASGFCSCRVREKQKQTKIQIAKVEKKREPKKKGIRMCEGIINHHSFSLIVPARPTFSPSRKKKKNPQKTTILLLSLIKRKFKKSCKNFEKRIFILRDLFRFPFAHIYNLFMYVCYVW